MKLLEKMILDEKNTKEDTEILRFGLEMMKTALIGILIAVVLGIIMGQPLQGCLLILVMLPLRQNAGGLHLKTKIGCTILSVMIYVAALITIKYFTAPPLMQIFVHLAVSLILIRFSPVDNCKNKLDNIEKEVYGSRARKILLFISILFYILIIMKRTDWSFIVMLGVFICAMLVILGQVKNELGLE